MKTAITVIDTKQVGMEEYRDVRTTKVFDDSTTILEIKQWIKIKLKLTKTEVENIGFSGIDISDVDE